MDALLSENFTSTEVCPNGRMDGWDKARNGGGFGRPPLPLPPLAPLPVKVGLFENRGVGTRGGKTAPLLRVQPLA